MSLINDALRRAREAQPMEPPTTAPGPHLRPVETGQSVRQGLDLLVPATLGIVVLLLLLLFWQWAHRNSQTQPARIPAQTALAKTAPAANAPALAPSPVADQPALSKTPSLPPSTVAAKAPLVEPVPPAPSTEVAGHSVPTSSALAKEGADRSNAGSESVAAPAAATSATPPVPKPAPLRLQGIMYHPVRPSAMISGKMLFVGDKLGELRVVAIGQDSATLVGGGQTNVLMLAQ